MAKAKCKVCKKELSSDRYSPTGKSPYYCNEEEYLSLHKLNLDRDELYELLRQIFYIDGGFVPPLMKQKINDLTNTYSYAIIKECFKEQRNCIEYALKNKEFENTAHMIRYVFVIIGNNIADTKIGDSIVNLDDNVDIDLLNNFRSCSRAKDISKWL